MNVDTLDGEPADITAFESRTVTFAINPVGSPVLTVQWYKNGVAMPNATNASITVGPLVFPTDNATYHVVVANSLNTATSRTATLTVLDDTFPPLAVSAASVVPQVIGLCFDEVIDSGTATDPFNYMINGSAPDSAELRADGKSVVLKSAVPLCVAPNTSSAKACA